jgi:hypothetical protein
MTDETELGEGAAVALGVFRRLSGNSKFGYDRESLAWVENYIESHRAGFTAEESQAFIGLVGAYLGECVRQAYGGSWTEKDGAWAIVFEHGGGAFPFSKSRKLMEDGLSGAESITSFFDVLPTILKLTRRSAITNLCQSLIRGFRRRV